MTDTPNCCADAQDGYGHHSGCPNYQRVPLPGVQVPYHNGKREYQQALRDFDCCATLPGMPDPVPGQLEDLAEAVAEMLDEAQHPPGVCYITPDETHCVCLIGKLKAVLPQCPAGGGPRDDSGGWRCMRTVHPTTPDRHFFGAV